MKNGEGPGLEDMLQIAPWVAGGLIVALILVLLHRPLKGLVRLLGRTGIGLGALYVLSYLGSFIGVALGVNLTNALVLGVLGVPGLGLLLLLHWTFL